MAPWYFHLNLRLRFIAVVRSVKDDSALNYFFQSDPRRFMFSTIDFDARARSPLELLTALRRQNDQAILGINLW